MTHFVTKRAPAVALLIALLLLPACAGQEAAQPTIAPTTGAAAATAADTVADAATVATPLPATVPAATPLPTATLAPDPATVEAAASPAAPTAAATRTGANYVLSLPREAAVPADWLMNPPPDFQTRSPGPGDTYRFACLELPARSTGLATVGYRSLEGLPSVAIEYAVYPSATEAGAALADMRQAASDCIEFTIGEGDNAIQAAFAPLDFPAHGDDSFAMALTTSGPTTGDLLTHVIKIQRGHVVIGISHAAAASGPLPDTALTESLAQLAVEQIDALTGE
ncbi:hypothetical protein [Promineifilum sp.]|uniref:hypothetical protein n=1 Tax=Promineifilum sp. TaxID=2664178 RepID=UPI0035B0582D